MGSKYYSNHQYAINFADFVTQSFHPVKAITTGEGGSILSNSKFYDNKFKLIRNHSIHRNNKKHWEYRVYEAGQNYRITDFQCALGISQLKKLNNFVKLRRKIANEYNFNLKNDERFITPSEKDEIYHSYHLYPLRINFSKIKLNKNELIKTFLKKALNYKSIIFHFIFSLFIKKCNF